MSQSHLKLPRGVWPLDDLGHFDLVLARPEHAQGENFLLLDHLFMISFLKTLLTRTIVEKSSRVGRARREKAAARKCRVEKRGVTCLAGGPGVSEGRPGAVARCHHSRLILKKDSTK